VNSSWRGSPSSGDGDGQQLGMMYVRPHDHLEHWQCFDDFCICLSYACGSPMTKQQECMTQPTSYGLKLAVLIPVVGCVREAAINGRRFSINAF
jgi:hypothetical protein